MILSTAEEASSSTSSKKNSNDGDNDGDGDSDEDRSNSNGDGNTNLHDSEFTADSITSEPESGTRWFGGIGTDFLHCLTDNVSPVVSGMATLVHKTAVAVANEISQLERDVELEAEAAAAEQSNEDCDEGAKVETDCSVINSSSSFDKSENLILPWEICQESSQNPTVKGEDDEIPVYFTDMELMKTIFALSSHDSNFLQPFSDKSPGVNELQKSSLSSDCSTFVMDEPRVKLIHRILDIDEKLASVHSRLTGGASNLSETSFWKNYYFHCERVRADEFCWRKNQNERTKTEFQSSSQTKPSNFVSFSPNNENVKLKSEKRNDDDESLVPVGSDIEGDQDDDSSYVIQSPPNTCETFATSRSIDDDLVLVDTHKRIVRKNQL